MTNQCIASVTDAYMHRHTHCACIHTRKLSHHMDDTKQYPSMHIKHITISQKRLASRSVGNTLINVHMQGETPLIVACAQGDYFDMKMLVAAGCQVNERSNIDDPSKLNDPQNNSCDRSTPLLVAAAGGFLDCVKYLIEEKKADTSAEDKVGSWISNVVMCVVFHGLIAQCGGLCDVSNA